MTREFQISSWSANVPSSKNNGTSHAWRNQPITFRLVPSVSGGEVAFLTENSLDALVFLHIFTSIPTNGQKGTATNRDSTVSYPKSSLWSSLARLYQAVFPGYKYRETFAATVRHANPGPTAIHKKTLPALNSVCSSTKLNALTTETNPLRTT